MALSALPLLNRLTARAKLRHMEALIVLSEQRSIGKAARAMRMSQPAMSQLLAELEKLIETQLFLRHAKGVDPTPVARDLLPVARRIIAATEESAELIVSRSRREGGLVRVATTAGGTGALLDPGLCEFAKAYPNVQVQVTEYLVQTVDPAFSGDEFDLVCSRRRAVLPQDWAFQPCYADRMVVICGASHPLARKASVSHEELGKATWLQNHVATPARHYFDELVAQAGWKKVREVRVLSRSAALIWSLLREGELLTMVPRSVVASWLANGLMKELPADIDMPLSDIGCHWRPERAGTVTRLLVECLSGLHLETGTARHPSTEH